MAGQHSGKVRAPSLWGCRFKSQKRFDRYNNYFLDKSTVTITVTIGHWNNSNN